MTLNYNVSGLERKALINAICEITNQVAIYNGVPSFSYTIGNFSVSRNGVVTVSTSVDKRHQDIELLAARLVSRGFRCIESEIEISDDCNALAIEIPLHGFTGTAINNLRKIVKSKEELIKKVLQTDDLQVELTGETLSFAWFTLSGIDGELRAYSQFVKAICEMAKRQKYVTAKPCSNENDKFTMRLFLVRLGFIGPEFKQARKILLRNLSGNSSWKYGQRPSADI